MAVRRRTWTTKSGEQRAAWTIDYVDHDGDRHIETFDRKKDADDRHAKVRVNVREGVHTAASKSVTVAQAAEDWITGVQLEGREATTVAQYRQHSQHIIRRIGDVKLANLTTPGLNRFRDELLSTVSRAMARKVISSLRSMLKDAQGRGNVAQNVALAIKRIDADKRGEYQLKIGTDIPAPDEIKAILAAAEPHATLADGCGIHRLAFIGIAWPPLDRRRFQGRRTTCSSARRSLRCHRQAKIESRPSDHTIRAVGASSVAGMEARRS